MKKRTEKNGSLNNDWKTPPYLLNEIKKEFGDFFDPCPYMADFDGLSIEWEQTNYINPPYDRKNKPLFINKAISESKKGKTCILLIPSNTETEDFKKLWSVATEIRFINKRIKFHGHNSKGEWVENKTGQTGSMLVILNGCKTNQPKISLIEYNTPKGS